MQHITSFGYDIAGNPIRVTDALSKTTAATFDALGQSTSVTDPLGHTATTVYDAAGHVQAVVDPLNHRTTYGYDAFDHQQTITDARNNTTTMLYDSAGNTVEVQDASGNNTIMAYDALNRLRSRLDPQSKQTVYAYDADSRLVGVTDRLNRQRVYNYDDADRRTGETWKDAAGTVAQLLTYTYDAADQMLSASNAAGVYSFGYDLAGRVQTVSEPYNLSLTFTYDAAGERTQVADNHGGVTTNVYDAAGRLTSRQLGGTVAAPARVDYGYSDRDELTDVTRYSDLAGTAKVGTTSYSYDDAGRLSNIQHNNASGGSLANYTYTYDAADRLTAKIDNGVTTPYNYYDDNQLQQDGAATYSYDATGNRTNPGYATGPDNRITSDGTWTYSYDDEGNTIKKTKGVNAETWTYGYDNANRMIWSEQRSSDGGPLLARVEYTYDVFGNRIRRVQYDGAMTVVSDNRYGQDGWDTAKPNAIGNENFEVYVDLDGGNNVTARRLYGAGFDQPAARVDASGVAWYLTDRQGSVRAVTDNTGAITGTRDYDAFGAITLEVGTGLDRYAYTAREWDGLLRLQYNHDRFYDPDTGRFTTEDPRDADRANSYRYTGNSPTNATDPSGLQPPPPPGESPSSLTAFLNNLFGTPPTVRQSRLFSEPAHHPPTLRSPEEVRYLLMTPEERAQERIRLLEEAIRQRDAQSERDRQDQALAWWAALPAERKLRHGPKLQQLYPAMSALGGAMTRPGFWSHADDRLPPTVEQIVGYYHTHLIMENDRPLQSTAGPIEMLVPGPAGFRAGSAVVTRLFRGGATTNRASAAVVLDAAAEHALLKSTAEDLASYLGKAQSNAARGPVLTVIRDRVTGELFDAQNLSSIPDKLHPLLQQRLKDYLEANGGNLNRVWGVPGSHSEIWALNQALLRREAIGLPMRSLDDFAMYNVSLWKNRLGTTVPRCGNCKFLTDGVRVLSGE